MLPVKSFLKRCRDEQIEIDALSEKRAALWASLLPKAVQPKEVDVQTSSPGDAMADVLAEVSELDRQIQAMVDNASRDHARALQIIGSIDKPVYRMVLELYYLSPGRMSWAQVSERMGYSERQTYQLHGQALLAAQKSAEDSSESQYYPGV